MKLSEIQDCVWFLGTGRWRNLDVCFKARNVSFCDKFNHFVLMVEGLLEKAVIYTCPAKSGTLWIGNMDVR